MGNRAKTKKVHKRPSLVHNSPLNGPHADNNDRLNNLESAVRILEQRMDQDHALLMEFFEQLRALRENFEEWKDHVLEGGKWG